MFPVKFSYFFLIYALFFNFVELLENWEICEILTVHNSIRAIHNASNMDKIEWNYYLADTAQKYADMCVWEHGHAPGVEPFNTNLLNDFDTVGQNLYYNVGPKKNLTHFTWRW